MKRLFMKIFSVTMACVVLFAVCGVDKVSYCCDECEKQGIEMLLSGTCHELHHGHESEHFCCESITHEELDAHAFYTFQNEGHEPCSMTFLKASIDLNTPNTESSHILPQIVTAILPDFSYSLENVPKYVDIELYGNNLFLYSPRELLSLHSVLLI